MSSIHELPPQPTYYELTQFGPVVSGFEAVFVEQVDPDDPDSRYVTATYPIDAFGLAVVAGDDERFGLVVSLFLKEGAWIIADESPQFCGVIRAGRPPTDTYIPAYYASRMAGHVQPD